MGFLGTLARWRDRVTERLQQGGGGPAVRVLRGLVLVGIILLLVVQLGGVGWNAIWEALPTHPLFYALLVVAYLSLPAAETMIYRRLWGLSMRDTFFACARKRVLNEEVLGYSGEVFYYLWGAKKGIETGEAFRSVRDANIVSSLMSFLVAGLLVAVMVTVGELDVSGWIGGQTVYIFAGVIVLAGGIALGLRFRRHVFALGRRDAAHVAGWYLARHLFANAAMIGMWTVAQPSVSLSVWLTFAAILVVIERLPFLPSKDLVFLGAGVELSKTMQVGTASIASMLLVQSASYKVLHVILFLLSTVFLRDAIGAEPPDLLIADALRDNALKDNESRIDTTGEALS